MNVYIKVKIKSLAEEARIIRLEETRAKARGDEMLLNQLHLHRVLVVRRAAREALLAYAWLRGRQYRQLEATAGERPRWAEVAKLATRYGRPTKPEDLEKWAMPEAQKVEAA